MLTRKGSIFTTRTRASLRKRHDDVVSDRLGDPRPRVDDAAVEALLRERFADVSGLATVRPGELSRVYRFEGAGRGYVLRLGQMGEGYAKDRLAYDRFAGAGLPIPEVVEVGRLGELWFCISTRLPGTPSNHVPPADYARARPAIAVTLQRIHALPSLGEGFGPVDEHGAGRFPSWRASVSAIGEETDGFWAGWRALFDTTFLERHVWDRLHGRMLERLALCPEERRVVHGDYGYDNVLIDDGRVTGILDWSNLMHGDPLYDVAWLQLFLPVNDGIVDEAAYPDFRTRVEAYWLRIGLDALRFYARTDQRPQYEHMKARLEALGLC
jgi:hygromycin-B 4-O-kinase